MRDMRVERPPAPFGQNAEIAARLRRLDHAEARLAAGNGKVEVRLGGDLEEVTEVRPALVGLSGRMLAVAIASNAPIGSRFYVDGGGRSGGSRQSEDFLGLAHAAQVIVSERD
jgi:hypothetical protein